MLTVKGLSKSYGNEKILDDVSLIVNQGEVLCLLGPSGCGKTTLLRCIAGLERIDSGNISINGESIADAPVHERNLGLMFQEYALFPHMDVASNVRFGLQMQSIAKSEQQARLEEVLRMVGLANFGRRSVTELSGGERQRVALARSLAPRPRLLMMDEPLGSLDAALREYLATELREIITAAGLTAIYVTHDHSEAFAVADRIAVMRRGCMEAVNTPEQLYLDPKTSFVARFLGLANIVPVLKHTGMTATTPVGDFAIAGSPRLLLLHPGGIALVNNRASHTIDGKVQKRVFRGASYQITISCGADIAITFDIPLGDTEIPCVGDNITISIANHMVIALDD